jgi:hypothetical protein
MIEETYPGEEEISATAGQLERRVIATITDVLSGPTLTRYSGWVQAQILKGEKRPNRIAIEVRFFELRPEWGRIAEVVITEGKAAPWVDFDLELTVGSTSNGGGRLSVSVPTSGNSKDYVLEIEYDSNKKPPIWLQVFQRNRLIQAMRVDEALQIEPEAAHAAPSSAR